MIDNLLLLPLLEWPGVWNQLAVRRQPCQSNSTKPTCMSIVWILLLEFLTNNLDCTIFSWASTIPSTVLIPMQVLVNRSITRYSPRLYLRIQLERFCHLANRLKLINRTKFNGFLRLFQSNSFFTRVREKLENGKRK